ncbi:hypothetical protein ALC53_06655 [Atta colombica]|uniref:Uncharacterized protein n=1 Tax=Atta colombica TaxID=520822 RepID=A0A195BEE5_9HYME|nr:hypothetical protein ALC53_06655 [Atta colombica]
MIEGGVVEMFRHTSPPHQPS